MESDIFRAGVRPGSPGTEVEVKMLLCYVLSNLEQAMTFDQLYEALSDHGIVNYFELIQLLEKLLETGHLSAVAPPGSPALYTATDLGTQAGDELGKDLPLTVREKSLASCRRLLARERRLSEVKISETPCQDGFMLEFAIPDDRGEILSLQVFSPTRHECELLKRRFLNAPLTIYKGIIALLTGDERVMGEIFTREEPLF